MNIFARAIKLEGREWGGGGQWEGKGGTCVILSTIRILFLKKVGRI